jgi:Helix-turn-helix domain
MSVDLPHLHNVLRDRTRAKILESLSEDGPLAYGEMQALLGIDHTGKLNYHLKLLGDLIVKDEQSGKYDLTEKGRLALVLLGKFQTAAAQSYRESRRRTWMIRGVMGVAVVAMALSVFFAVIGVPYTQASVSETCSTASGCAQSVGAVTQGFAPTEWAFVPLVAGGLVALGLVGKRTAISWAGTVLLAAFSFVSLFSIGPLYVPLVLLLSGFLAAIPRAATNSP